MKTLISIAVMSVVTLMTRAIPFIVFRENRKTPKLIKYLGDVLPYAIIGMLVVYCLKGMDILGPTHGLAEIIAVIYVVIAHKLWHNLVVSIGGGTVLYMLLVQLVFAA